MHYELIVRFTDNHALVPLLPNDQLFLISIERKKQVIVIKKIGKRRNRLGRVNDSSHKTITKSECYHAIKRVVVLDGFWCQCGRHLKVLCVC